MVWDFWRVRVGSILVDKPGFGRVQILVFPELGLGLACFRPKRFKVQAFWRGFKVQFWFDEPGFK